MTLRVHLVANRPGLSLDARFEVPPGVTALFGPSGAGKSTCLAVIAGLLRPDRGTVSLGDEVWLDTARGIDKPIHHRGVAFVFQSLALFPHLSGLANVSYGIGRAVPSAERTRRALAMMERMRCRHVAERKPPTYSGGEAQRVALARAFAMGPRLMLLDEPMSALDRTLRGELCADIRELAQTLGIPVILVTHQPSEVRALAERVLLLRGGRVIAEGGLELAMQGFSEPETPASERTFDFADTPLPTSPRLASSG
jgi:molybdate transport system ATP-binding protein